MNTCPTCGKPHASPQAGDNTATARLDVPLHLLPALEHALAIGRNTAMMCAGKDSDTEVAFEELRSSLLPMISSAAAYFSEYQWFTMFHRSRQGRAIEVALHRDHAYWRSGYKIQVTDPTGERWPRQWEDGPMFSEAIEDKEEAEKLAQVLKEELERFFPMS